MKNNKLLVILGSIFVVFTLAYIYHINSATRKEGLFGKGKNTRANAPTRADSPTPEPGPGEPGGQPVPGSGPTRGEWANNPLYESAADRQTAAHQLGVQSQWNDPAVVPADDHLYENTPVDHQYDVFRPKQPGLGGKNEQGYYDADPVGGVGDPTPGVYTGRPMAGAVDGAGPGGTGTGVFSRDRVNLRAAPKKGTISDAGQRAVESGSKMSGPTNPTPGEGNTGEVFPDE